MARAHTRAEQKRKNRTRTIFIVIGSIALILVAGVLAVIVAGKKVVDTFDEGTTKVEAFPEESERPPAAEDGSQTILLLGSDTRGQIDPDDIDADQDSRSDSIMVMRIPGDREGVYVMSIMRDAWVNIPGHGEAKINAAMAYGGVPLTVQTVETLIGSRIDHVALIDFEGFKGLTDALGGVTVINEGEFSAGGHVFPAGPIQLRGEEALAFVRERKSFGEGDYRRVKNQQAYIKGVTSQLVSRGTLMDPGKIQDSVAAISPYLTVDTEFTSGYLLRLAPSLRDLRPGDITFFTAPTDGVGVSPDGQSIVFLDKTRMELVREAFETDTLAEYVATQDLAPY